MRLLFRLSILLGSFMLSTIGLQAQDLYQSRRTSTYTYIYRITSAEARWLAQKGLDYVHTGLFHTLVDSCLTDSLYRGHLPVGQYLQVMTASEQLQVSWFPVSALRPLLLNNHRDFQLVLYDTLGSVATDAVLKLDGRRVRFDPATRTYRASRIRRSGVLEMVTGGDTLIWRVADTRPGWVVTTGKKVLYTPPVRWVWVPLYQTVHMGINAARGNWWSVRYTLNPLNWYTVRKVRNWIRWPEPPQVSVILSQPMYRPGDTVQLSAFCYKSSGRPYKRPLNLWVQRLGPGPMLNRRLAELTPDHPGHYQYSWVLHDSLPLLLDHVYELVLSGNRSSGKADFKLADYELTISTLKLSASSSVHSGREPVTLTLEGRDDNNLLLRQARYEVYLTAETVLRLNTAALTIPDTLWQISGELAADLPTQVVIPDSIFPAADLVYNAQAILHTASQERHETTTRITHLNAEGRLALGIVGDSLEIKYLQAGVSSPRTVELEVRDDHQKSLSRHSLTVPARIPVHPLACTYIARSAGTQPETLKLGDKARVAAWRSHDSLYLQVDYATGQPYWYHVYRRNREVARGQASSYMERVFPASYKGPYTVSIQYPGPAGIVAQDYQVPSARHTLTLSQTYPEAAYPGQTIRVSLTARTPKGKPLSGTTITSWALTQKFDVYTPPKPPDWTPDPQRRKVFNVYEREQQDTARQLMEYPYWARRMGLDTIAWYQFLYPPAGLYTTYVPDEDKITQGALFISDNGRLVPAAIVWHDERPVFFLQTSGEYQYVFHAEPGYHTVKIRTARHEILIDSVYYKAGHKLILCLDLHHPPAGVMVRPAPEQLSDMELSGLRTYLMWVLPVRNNTGVSTFDYIRQGRRVWTLKSTDTNLLGPLYKDTVEYVRPGYNGITTQFESGYQWQYEPPAVKMKYMPTYAAAGLLSGRTVRMSIYDRVLTVAMIQAQWNHYVATISASVIWYDDQKVTQPGHVQVVQIVGVPCEQLWVFRQDDPMYLRVYQPGKTILHDFAPGLYDFVWISSDSTYRLQAGVRLAQGHTTYVDASLLPEQVADRFFREMFHRRNAIISSPGYIRDQKTAIREIYHQAWHTQPTSGNWHLLSGRVMDTFGSPLSGATVVVKSPESGPVPTGVLADAQGYFSLKVPPRSVIVIQYIGYEEREVWYHGQPYLSVELKPMTMQMDEVVIVGYSAQSKREVTSAIQSVAIRGMVSGLTIKDVQPANTLYYLDGMRTRDQLPMVSDLASEAGQPDTAGLLEPELRIRSRFRDRAWWQPLLVTDETGTVSFQVTMPDDITRWRTFAQGVAPGRYAGQTEGALRVMRTRVAQLYGPRFMVQGDTATWIGQIRNYTRDSLRVWVRAEMGDSLRMQSEIWLASEHIDSLVVVAPAVDSLRAAYSFQDRITGEGDGEQYTIPLYPPGSQERAGICRELYGPGQVVWSPDSTHGDVHLMAYADVLPFIWLEMNRLRAYPYLCNEQVASKLRGLLLEQRLCQQEGRPFMDKVAVDRLIRRLLRDELPDGGWGWWPGNTTVSPWITAHVTQALLRARDQGWTVNWDDGDLRARAILETSGEAITAQHLPWIEVLIRLKAPGAATQPLNRLAAVDSLPLYPYIQLQRLRAEAGLPARIDSVITLAHTGAMGYLYWADYSRQPYTPSQNSLQASIDAYDLIHILRPADPALPLIRQYWLAQYGPYGWANTYESIRVSERLADVALISTRPGTFKAALSWQADGHMMQADSFPYAVTFPARDTLTLNKSGENTIYLTLYQTWQEAHPARVDSTFGVKTWFSDSTDLLQAGVPTVLKVSLTVRRYAEYILLEIPIPAGCSYDTRRPAPRGPHETWRETSRHQTSIACQALEPGTYTFTVSLLPRYTGRYTLNPATAALMYAPLNLGRNEVRTVWVR